MRTLGGSESFRSIHSVYTYLGVFNAICQAVIDHGMGLAGLSGNRRRRGYLGLTHSCVQDISTEESEKRKILWVFSGGSSYSSSFSCQKPKTKQIDDTNFFICKAFYSPSEGFSAGGAPPSLPPVLIVGYYSENHVFLCLV